MNLPLARQKSPPLPPWLTASVKLGVPSVIALFLVLWLTQTLSARIDANGARIERNTTATLDTQRAVAEHVLEMKSDARIQQGLLRAICKSLAKSEFESEACEVGR